MEQKPSDDPEDPPHSSTREYDTSGPRWIRTGESPPPAVRSGAQPPAASSAPNSAPTGAGRGRSRCSA